MFDIYAASYLDSNGHVKSYGYVETVSGLAPGTIISDWAGTMIRIDFPMPKGEEDK